MELAPWTMLLPGAPLALATVAVTLVADELPSSTDPARERSNRSDPMYGTVVPFMPDTVSAIMQAAGVLNRLGRPVPASGTHAGNQQEGYSMRSLPRSG